jgi:hypothetical protein
MRSMGARPLGVKRILGELSQSRSQFVDNQLLTADNANASRLAVVWIESREIAWLAFIVISLSILSASASRAAP